MLLFFELCSFIRIFGFAEDTFTRQNLRKTLFFFDLCSFIRIFVDIINAFTDGKRRKGQVEIRHLWQCVSG